MLVLTRKQSETIQIGNSITITVLRMKGKAVRLGIQAPQDYNVIRGELAFDLNDEDGSLVPVNQDVPELEQAKKSNLSKRDYRKDSWTAKTVEAAESTSGHAVGAWSI